MRFSVFVLSHNKNGYIQEALDSILEQDFMDYELCIIENSTDNVTRQAVEQYITYLDDDCKNQIMYVYVDVPPAVRSGLYVPSWLLNQYYPQARGEIILFLSDDDLFMPGLFTAVDRAFTDNPEWHALYYGLMRTLGTAPGDGMSWDEGVSSLGVDGPRGSGEVDCKIDACQIAYKKSVLDYVPQPYFDEGMAQASHSDGTHLQKIAEHFTFQPLNVPGVIHRHTPLSTWTKYV